LIALITSRIQDLISAKTYFFSLQYFFYNSVNTLRQNRLGDTEGTATRSQTAKPWDIRPTKTPLAQGPTSKIGFLSKAIEF
jgi:hypothetical protein